jgi:hypothetical protein
MTPYSSSPEATASPYSARVGSHSAIHHYTNWHRMVKHKCILAEEHDVHDCAMQSSSVMLGQANHHSAISAVGQMKASMTHQSLKCD